MWWIRRYKKTNEIFKNIRIIYRKLVINWRITTIKTINRQLRSLASKLSFLLKKTWYYGKKQPESSPKNQAILKLSPRHGGNPKSSWIEASSIIREIA